MIWRTMVRRIWRTSQKTAVLRPFREGMVAPEGLQQVSDSN